MYAIRSYYEIASKVTPQYGIDLIDVIIKRVNYIDSVRLKVYDRMISERKRIAAEKRSTGEGQKAEILGTVERKLKEIISVITSYSIHYTKLYDQKNREEECCSNPFLQRP